MGRARSTHGRRGADRILCENLDEGDHLEDTRVNGEIILKWIFVKWDEDWIDVAQDTDRWLVNAVMKLRVP